MEEESLVPKIKDLPAGIGLLALMEQVEQGNLSNPELTILAREEDGGFSWTMSTQGWKFWAEIYCTYKPTVEIPQ